MRACFARILPATVTVAIAVGLALGHPTTAHAQATTTPVAADLPIDAFRPAIDSRGYLSVNGAQPLGSGELSFGLGALSWGHGLLELRDGDRTYTVDDVITATLGAAIGFEIGPAELELAASLPLVVLAGDRGPDDPGVLGDANDDRAFAFSAQGLGDAGLHLKARLLAPRGRLALGVAAIASLSLPTASPAQRFLGDRALVPQLIGVVEREFGRLRLAINGGVRLRSTARFVDQGGGEPGAPATGEAIAVSTELPFGIAAAVAISPRRFELIGEVFGALPLGEHRGYQALEALAGIKLYLARNSFLTLGAGRGLRPDLAANPDARAMIGIVFEPRSADRDGDGLRDDRDRCPDEPEDRDGFEDSDGCPDLDNDRDGIVDRDDRCPDVPEDRDGFDDEDGCPEDDPAGGDAPDPDPGLDSDRDGIVDRDDLCPDQPEDRDGFEDEDGCPDLDNDRDRISDRDDRCPDRPETYNDVDDTDGCPDRGRAELTRTGIVTLEEIRFRYDSAEIHPDSYPIVDAVAAAMQGNPDIELFEVAGHTDERGDDAYNLDLSERRVRSVIAYLVRKRVDPARLSGQGYGETQPLVRASNQAAWARNRRVEFVILRPRR